MANYPALGATYLPSLQALTVTETTVTTTDVSAAVNTHYVCTVAGMTADRNVILPVGSPGDRIRVTVLDGDDAYELIIKGDTGISINGGSAATEWSRLFIANETVLFEAVSASLWIVVHDGRIPQHALRVYGTGSQDITTSAAAVLGLSNVLTDPCSLDSGDGYGFTPRRSGLYRADYSFAGTTATSSTAAVPAVSVSVDGGTTTTGVSGYGANGASVTSWRNAKSTVVLDYDISTDGSIVVKGTAYGNTITVSYSSALELLEVLHP